jgi:hypothetical protein
MNVLHMSCWGYKACYFQKIYVSVYLCYGERVHYLKAVDKLENSLIYRNP